MNTKKALQQKLFRKREAARVGEPAELLELLDMAAVLLDAGFPVESVARAMDFPVQGGVSKERRLLEALEIARAWSEESLVAARRYGADWHALLEPARWWRQGRLEREALDRFTREFTSRLGRWPRADDMRRRFGMAPGHRAPGEQPGQGVLSGG